MVKNYKYFPNNRICNTGNNPDPNYIWEMVVHRKVDTRVDINTYIRAGIYTYVFDCFDDCSDYERGIYQFSTYSEIEIISITRKNLIKQLNIDYNYD